jgi:hypothetical protein
MAGCTRTRDSLGSAAVATTLSPALASYGIAYAANNTSQASSIGLGASPEAFSEEISLDMMRALSRGFDMSGLWVNARWKYMGTQQGYHFLAYYSPVAGMRRIYRIKESQLQIDAPFALKPFDSEWRTFHMDGTPPAGPVGPPSFLSWTNLYRTNSLFLFTNESLLDLHYPIKPSTFTVTNGPIIHQR